MLRVQLQHIYNVTFLIKLLVESNEGHIWCVLSSSIINNAWQDKGFFNLYETKTNSGGNDQSKQCDTLRTYDGGQTYTSNKTPLMIKSKKKHFMLVVVAGG